MSSRQIVSCILILLLVFGSSDIRADSGVDPSEVWMPDGTVRWEDLTRIGFVRKPVQGVPLLREALFEAYRTRSGDLVLIPSLTTGIAMRAFPEQFSAYTRGVGMRTAVGVTSLGDAYRWLNDELHVTPELLRQYEYDDEQDFYADLMQGRGKVWTLGFWTATQMLAHAMYNAFTHHAVMYGSAILLFDRQQAPPEALALLSEDDHRREEPPDDDNDDDDDDPAPAGGDDCDRDPHVSAPPPRLVAQQVEPPYPVVIGQDPNQRGVDIRIFVEIPPVKVSYNERRTLPDGTVTCERVTETFEDPVRRLAVTVELSAESISWITHDLGRRYPGAAVRAPVHELIPPGGWPQRSRIEHAFERVPLADPGEYAIIIEGQTTGTPYTRPRSLSHQEFFRVWLADSTLSTP